MKKGKFGIVLCFYPIAAFSAAILHAPLICAGLAAAAAFLERDEWAARQSLQAWMLSALVFFVRTAAGWGSFGVLYPIFLPAFDHHFYCSSGPCLPCLCVIQHSWHYPYCKGRRGQYSSAFGLGLPGIWQGKGKACASCLSVCSL